MKCYGGYQVVSVISFILDGPSLNPTEVYGFIV